MRLARLRVSGLLAFPREVALDLAGIPGRLVAVMGENGVGKTALLESPLAALYRQLRSRDGSLYEHFSAEGFIEAVFFDPQGAEVIARVQVDPGRRKTEQHLFVNGAPITTGRKGEIEAEVLKRFGSLEMVSASVFAAQNRAGDLVTLPRASRKALFVELLGLGHYERMAQAAVERGRALEADLRTANAHVHELTGLRQQVAAQEGLLEQALATVTEREAGVAEAQRHLSLARERETAVHARQAAERDVKQAETDLSRAQAAHESAVGRVQHVQVAAEERAQALSHARVDLERRAAELDALPMVEEPSADDRQAAHVKLEVARDACQGARSAIPIVEAAYQRLAVAEQDMARAQSALDAKKTALADQAAPLDSAPCVVLVPRVEPWLPPKTSKPSLGSAPVWQALRDMPATCPLLSAARDARDTLATLELDSRLQQEVVEARQECADKMTSEAARAKLADYEDALKVAESASQALAHRAALASQQHADTDRQRQNIVAARRELDSRQATDAAIAARELTAAEKSVNEWAQAVVDAIVQQAAARQALDAHPAPPSDALSVTGADAVLRMAQVALRRAEAEKATAVGALNVLHQQVAWRERASAEAERLAGDIGDWQTLARALGRDGLQALELDAAGPAIAELVNELLTECWGTRFTLRFETQRALKSRDGFEEVFELRVYDAEAQAERQVERLSGGEQVVVSEALALAIAIFNARRHGIAWRTLVRDETAGALSPNNARAYMAMLRRAADLGQFEQVLFVSHLPELWAMADARITIQKGGKLAFD